MLPRTHCEERLRIAFLRALPLLPCRPQVISTLQLLATEALILQIYL